MCVCVCVYFAFDLVLYFVFASICSLPCVVPHLVLLLLVPHLALLLLTSVNIVRLGYYCSLLALVVIIC